MNSAFGICNQLKGHPDAFYSNYVVLDGDGGIGGGQECTTSASADATIVHDNQYFTPTGAVSECGKPLAAWQATGGDPGSVAAAWPDTATLVAKARSTLGM